MLVKYVRIQHYLNFLIIICSSILIFVYHVIQYDKCLLHYIVDLQSPEHTLSIRMQTTQAK